jgi:quinol monooxygenase YgiN
MISFAVKMTFAPEDRAEVGESLRELATASRQEPGCINYIPHHSEDDPDTVFIYEQYRDTKALAERGESDCSRLRFLPHSASGAFGISAVVYGKLIRRKCAAS